jgi:hypothetical protein
LFVNVSYDGHGPTKAPIVISHHDERPDFWDVTPCSLIERNECFGGIYGVFILKMETGDPSEMLITDPTTLRPSPEDSNLHQSSSLYLSLVRPQFGKLVGGLLPWMPEFSPSVIIVGFVVDEVALGQVFLRALRFSPASYNSRQYCTLVCHQGLTKADARPDLALTTNNEHLVDRNTKDGVTG